MRVRLDGQIALVTGGDSGLGREIAIQFAKAGASVAINYEHDEAYAMEVVGEIELAGGRSFCAHCDVSDESDVEKLFRSVVEAFGGLDILVATCGMPDDAETIEMTAAKRDALVDISQMHHFLCSSTAVRIFRGQGPQGHSRATGVILCMCPLHEAAGGDGDALAKPGLSVAMQTLAREVAPEKIRINGVAHGATATPSTDDAGKDDGRKILEMIPYGRLGVPIDVARVAVFLASDLADYVVGTTIFVDGGMALSRSPMGRPDEN
jgi:glucose 1-dehydrogenase